MRDEHDVMPLFRQLGAALTKFARIERKPLDFGIGPLLFPAEVHMLSTIEALGDAATVTAIAAACGVTKGAVSQTLKRLEGKGLIRRDATDGHGNRGGVGLSALGERASQAHLDFHRVHDWDFLTYLRGLSEADFAVCLEFSRRLRAWMENYPE